jgi:co-chaperonin GroES (HSP10)
MRLEPLGKVIVGRLVDITKSKGGLELPTSQVKNVTVFLLVDSVGPDVTKCKPGDIVLYQKMGHVWTRDGTHFGLAEEDDIKCIVKELDPATIVIEGEEKWNLRDPNGPPAPAPAPSRLIT